MAALESILDSVKQMHGISADDTNFDAELILHINGALMILNQLGVGPAEGFRINGKDEKWSDLIGTRKDLDLIVSDVYLRVKLVFDPPQNSFLVNAMKEERQEYDWRIETYHEEDHEIPNEIVDPYTLDDEEDPFYD